MIENRQGEPTAAQRFDGPDTVELPSASAKDWWEKHLSLRRFTTWTDPHEAFVVYSIPLDLRPTDLVPVIRQSRWQYQLARKSGDIGKFMSIAYYRPIRQDAELLADSLGDLAAALVQFPFVFEEIRPWVTVEYEAVARKIREVEWRTGLHRAELHWTTGERRSLDTAWERQWTILAEIARRSEPCEDYKEFYY